MWTSLSKKLYLFMSIVLVIGIITGVIFVIMLDEATKEILFLNINNFLQSFGASNISILVQHLVILSTLLILSIFLIGGPFVIFFMFYNGFTIGFIISSITCIFGIKGMLFGVLYVIVSKLVFVVLFIIFDSPQLCCIFNPWSYGSKNILFKIVKCVIDYLVYKKSNKESLVMFMKRSIVFIGIIMISDIILYFGGVKLINIFNFLIK